MNSATPKNKTNPNLEVFRAYPVEQAVAIIRAIAEHRWPISVEEAFSLRDQFGWTPAPDDGRFFVTPLSRGEEDGHIGLDVSDKNYISRIDVNLCSRISGDADPSVQAAMRSAYSAYVAELTSLYGTGSPGFSDTVETLSWYLPSRASVNLGITQRSISVMIESPAMTDLTEAEEQYFAEGGEL